MECVQNLLLGDPVYDERGQLVRREFGLKNALALLVLGYIAYTLYCSMGKKVFSGKRKGRKGKMKGGGDTDGESDGESDGGSDGGGGPITAFIFGFGVLISFLSCKNIGSDPTALGQCILLPIATLGVSAMAFALEGDEGHLKAKTKQGPGDS